MNHRKISLSDQNQNFWHLASIQTASLGFAGIVMSPTLANRYGANAAITSSLLSGLILWLIGFAIVAMAIEQRRNAIENAEAYIGRTGATLASLISIIGFPIWYVYQVFTTTNSIGDVLQGDIPTRPFALGIYGTILSLFIALLALGKLIHLIKKLNTIFLPILVCYYVYATIVSDRSQAFTGFKFSLPCTLAYISFLFSGMVNLPTFFRHARTKYDSYLALTFITIVVVFFQISSIWVGSNVMAGIPFAISGNASSFLLVVVKLINVSFLLTLLLCSNLVNLYFASPSLELLIPKINKFPKFFIIGLASTVIFIFSVVFPTFYELLNDSNHIADDFIANLGTSLMLIFLIRAIVMHRPKPLEKKISFLAWLVGCSTTAYAYIRGFEAPLLLGIAATILFFITAFYIEEPYWSMKKLRELLKEKSQ